MSCKHNNSRFSPLNRTQKIIIHLKPVDAKYSQGLQFVWGQSIDLARVTSSTARDLLEKIKQQMGQIGSGKGRSNNIRSIIERHNQWIDFVHYVDIQRHELNTRSGEKYFRQILFSSQILYDSYPRWRNDLSCVSSIRGFKQFRRQCDTSPPITAGRK